jgi:hypothetical protein
MSYDLTIAAYRELGADTIEAWAREQGFEVVAATDGKSYVVQRHGRGDAGFVCEVFAPDPAEAERGGNVDAHARVVHSTVILAFGSRGARPAAPAPMS